jgi:hypothetical protein
LINPEYQLRYLLGVVAGVGDNLPHFSSWSSVKLLSTTYYFFSSMACSTSLSLLSSTLFFVIFFYGTKTHWAELSTRTSVLACTIIGTRPLDLSRKLGRTIHTLLSKILVSALLPMSSLYLDPCVSSTWVTVALICTLDWIFILCTTDIPSGRPSFWNLIFGIKMSDSTPCL